MAVLSTFIQTHFKDFEHLLQKPVFLFQDRDFGFEGLGFGEKFQEQVDKPFGMRIGSDPVGILGSGKRDP